MDNGNGLFGFIKAHLPEFRIGGILGFIGSGSWLFLDAGTWSHLAIEWVVRLFFTVLIAVCTAFGSAWAKDAYQNFKEYRKKKEREHELRQRAKPRKDRAA